MLQPLQPRSDPSLVMPVLAAIVAVAIFVVDTVTPLDIADRRALRRRRAAGDGLRRAQGILIVAAGCAALTVLSYVITHDA